MYNSAAATTKTSKPHKPMSEARRVRKPLMERKRRERINSSLEQLALLLKEAKLVAADKPVAKLEKADILELTVRHLKTVKSLNVSPNTSEYENKASEASLKTEANSLNNPETGFALQEQPLPIVMYSQKASQNSTMLLQDSIKFDFIPLDPTASTASTSTASQISVPSPKVEKRDSELVECEAHYFATINPEPTISLSIDQVHGKIPTVDARRKLTTSKNLITVGDQLVLTSSYRNTGFSRDQNESAKIPSSNPNLISSLTSKNFQIKNISPSIREKYSKSPPAELKPSSSSLSPEKIISETKVDQGYVSGFLKCLSTVESLLRKHQTKEMAPIEGRLMDHLTKCLQELPLRRKLIDFNSPQQVQSSESSNSCFLDSSCSRSAELTSTDDKSFEERLLLNDTHRSSNDSAYHSTIDNNSGINVVINQKNDVQLHYSETRNENGDIDPDKSNMQLHIKNMDEIRCYKHETEYRDLPIFSCRDRQATASVPLNPEPAVANPQHEKFSRSVSVDSLFLPDMHIGAPVRTSNSMENNEILNYETGFQGRQVQNNCIPTDSTNCSLEIKETIENLCSDAPQSHKKRLPNTQSEMQSNVISSLQTLNSGSILNDTCVNDFGSIKSRQLMDLDSPSGSSVKWSRDGAEERDTDVTGPRPADSDSEVTSLLSASGVTCPLKEQAPHASADSKWSENDTKSHGAGRKQMKRKRTNVDHFSDDDDRQPKTRRPQDCDKICPIDRASSPINIIPSENIRLSDNYQTLPAGVEVKPFESVPRNFQLSNSPHFSNVSIDSHVTESDSMCKQKFYGTKSGDHVISHSIPAHLNRMLALTTRSSAQRKEYTTSKSISTARTATPFVNTVEPSRSSAIAFPQLFSSTSTKTSLSNSVTLVKQRKPLGAIENTINNPSPLNLTSRNVHFDHSLAGGSGLNKIRNWGYDNLAIKPILISGNKCVSGNPSTSSPLYRHEQPSNVSLPRRRVDEAAILYNQIQINDENRQGGGRNNQIIDSPNMWRPW